MGIFKKDKTPQQRIRESDKKLYNLREKRSKLPSCEEKKITNLNKQIRAQKVEKEIAFTELKNPGVKVDNSNKTTNFNFNKNKKSLHLHGHYHNDKKKD